MMIVIDRISVVHIFMADTIKMVSTVDLIFQDALCLGMKDLMLILKIHVLIYYFVSRFMHLSFFFFTKFSHLQKKYFLKFWFIFNYHVCFTYIYEM